MLATLQWLGVVPSVRGGHDRNGNGARAGVAGVASAHATAQGARCLRALGVRSGSASAPATLKPWVFQGGPAEPAEPVVTVEPTTISVSHWKRLGDGEMFATSRYVDWATLMKRTWNINVMKCPACSHRLRVLATITDRAVVRKILDHLGVRSTPLPRAPARDPSWEQQSFDHEAA